VTEDLETPWARKAKHTSAQVRRMGEDLLEKSYLRQPPGLRWIFVSVKDRTAHY
jgi:hypothetical protein